MLMTDTSHQRRGAWGCPFFQVWATAPQSFCAHPWLAVLPGKHITNGVWFFTIITCTGTFPKQFRNYSNSKVFWLKVNRLTKVWPKRKTVITKWPWKSFTEFREVTQRSVCGALAPLLHRRSTYLCIFSDWPATPQSLQEFAKLRLQQLTQVQPI